MISMYHLQSATNAVVRVDQQATDEKDGSKSSEQDVLDLKLEHGEVGVVNALGQFEQDVAHVVQHEHHVADTLETSDNTTLV